MEKRSLRSKAILLSALVMLFILAVAAPPAAAQVIGTPISSVPTTITAPGVYYFTGNLTTLPARLRGEIPPPPDGPVICPPQGCHGPPPIEPEDGIVVEADNVTIDLMGFTLTGSGGAVGISMVGRRNVTVRNGTVRNFGAGIRDTGGDQVPVGHRIINVRVVENGLSGIHLIGFGHLVQSCYAYENDGSHGIFVQGASLVTDSIAIYNDQTGIAAGGGSTVKDSVAYDNGYVGISVTSGLVDGNTASENEVDIECTGCTLGTNH